MSIEVEHLLKQYGSQKAVNNISFTVNKGEIVGFLGPNGAGKSTTMKIITGYLQADSGIAKVCGIDVKNNPIEAKKKIGYLPEANPLYFDMYVKEYLGFVAGVHKVKQPTSRMKSVIELTGLQVEQSKKIGQLSKGYKQRVGLAAALIHDPEVLILDEPTSGLDPNQILEIRNMIKQQGQNKTVLFSSHILQEVQAMCDRVVIINKGQMVADDTVTNLQRNKQQAQVVIVSFEGKVTLSTIQQLNHITAVEQLQGPTFRIQSADAESVRKQLLQLALQQQLNIVSLQTETVSLEDVFRNLTR